jgi:hypothetical protein
MWSCESADGKQNVKNNTPLLLLARRENSFHLILTIFSLTAFVGVYIYMRREAALF